MPADTRVCVSLALFFALFARNAEAQANNTRAGTTVSGVVTDSIDHTRLANATVQLIANDDPAHFARTVVSDSLGRFSVADVPAGKYRIGFFHPILDSLGLEAPLHEVDVDTRPVIADLAVPSVARLRGAMCGSQSAADSAGFIVGIVRDARDESPLEGVKVLGDWFEFSLGRDGLTRRRARRTAMTAANGWFVLCDVPNGGAVALVASKGADSTGLIEVQVPADGFVRRELYLAPASIEPATAAANLSTDTTFSNRRIHVGSGHFSGIVVSAAGNRPLAGAEVSITDGPQTKTNERGEWTLSNAPPGTRMFEVHAIGYYPYTGHVNIVAQTAPVHVALTTLKAVLDTVRILASRLPNGGGFEQRRRSGQGHYVTPDDIRRFPVTVTSDIFQRVPGVQLEDDGHGGKYVKIRGAFEKFCSPAIFIDDHNMSFLTLDDLDTWVHPQEIAGIEVYNEGNVPPQFQVGLSGCGSIVIWTK